MNNIFILDGQTDEVLGHINKKYVIDNEHEKDLPSHKDYFRFTVLADNKHAEHLTKRNGLIIPGEDGELLEFRIFESIKYRNNEGLFIEVHALATYLDLKTQKIFDPNKTSEETALQHATIALNGTEWQVGEIDFKGIRTITFDNPFNSYDYILRIAREFELEPRFYIKTDGNKITGRYVDLIERIGEFRGRTIEFGRDLQSIRRKEDTSEVVTALWVYGPEKEDGARLKVLVEDDEALQRWGRRGQHIIDYYETQTENQDITEERLKTLGEMELRKRINAVVTYEAEIVDLENVPGMENKKIRIGDTIRIKDTKFNPPLYLEARVHNQKRDVFRRDSKRVILGDYIEYTEDEVKAIFNQLREQIKRKISMAEVVEVAELKIHRDSYPPEDTDRLWLDSSKGTPILKEFDVEKQEWIEVGDGSAVVTDDSFPDTVPPIPTNFKADGLYKIIKLSWDYDPSSYIAAYEVYASQEEGFTPELSNLVWRGKSGGYNHEADINQKWYFRVRAINTHGTASDFSEEVKGATVKINAQTDIQPLTITNELIAENAAIDFAKIANVEITNAMIDYVVADKIRGGSFEGQRFTGGQFEGTSMITLRTVSGITYKTIFENGRGVFETYRSSDATTNSITIDGDGIFQISDGLFNTNDFNFATRNSFVFQSTRGQPFRIEDSDLILSNDRRISAGRADISGDIRFGSDPAILTAGSTFSQWFPSVDSSSYIRLRKSDGQVAFMQNGTFRHIFNESGTKAGGSIEIDGYVYGMSPIDSPQVLLEYIEFDIPLSMEGTTVYLDETYLKSVNYEFAVFINNGVISDKGRDYFTVLGEGACDARIVGERVGYENVFYSNMYDDEDSEVEEIET